MEKKYEDKIKSCHEFGDEQQKKLEKFLVSIRNNEKNYDWELKVTPFNEFDKNDANFVIKKAKELTEFQIYNNIYPNSYCEKLVNNIIYYLTNGLYEYEV